MISTRTIIKKFGFCDEEKGFNSQSWNFTSGYAVKFSKENTEYTFYDDEHAVLQKEYRTESQHSLHNYIETCKKLKKAGYDRISSYQDCNNSRDYFTSSWNKKNHEVHVMWCSSWIWCDETLVITHSQWSKNF